MKRSVVTILPALFILIILLCGRSFSLAQGTLYLSNLGEISGGSVAVAQNAYAAQAFNVGDNYVGIRNEGFLLNSIQVLAGTPNGNPSGFSLAIYDGATRNEGPGNFIASLTGATPNAQGIYTFTASNVMLFPELHYWIVMTSTSLLAEGSFSWRESSTLNFQSSDPWWTPYPSHDSSSDGITWTINNDRPFQFAVYATPVPEPSVLILFSLAGSCLAAGRIRRAHLPSR